MAPDKIYIHQKNEHFEITWSEVEEKNCTNDVYIRKELLMEFSDTIRRYVCPTRDDKFCSRSELLHALAKFNELIK